jgi:segregation and condensation protein A
MPQDLPDSLMKDTAGALPAARPQRPDSENPLHVKLAVYEGPLDLLLDLIKKNEMDIYNIPMAEITRQYLDYLARMKTLNLEIAGEFLVLAATLVYIKSKMLLPPDGTEEEDEGVDPREELMRKLLEYQAFKEAAKNLGWMESERGRYFTREIADYYFKELTEQESGEPEVFSASLHDLLQAFQSVLKQFSREDFHEVLEEIISIEEKIEVIKQWLAERSEFRFRELFHGKLTRNELIATFLALLEIVRSKFAKVSQPERFGDIMIQRAVK